MPKEKTLLRIIIFAGLLLVGTLHQGYAQGPPAKKKQKSPIGFKYFFHPLSPASNPFGHNRGRFAFKPILQVPLVNFSQKYDSEGANTQPHVAYTAGAGLGITINYIVTRKHRNYNKYNFALLNFIAGRDETGFNLYYAGTIGFFNSKLQLGIGYDLIEKSERQRAFLIGGIGVNLTTN